MSENGEQAPPALSIMTPMTLDTATCYRALRARDARFDGRFFVAVSSTRIYCRPVCTVKPPRFEHCRFYPSAAAAEVAGYRPCLRCRPELAPGNASVDATTRVAQAAASLIEDRTLDAEGLAAIASRDIASGCSALDDTIHSYTSRSDRASKNRVVISESEGAASAASTRRPCGSRRTSRR